MNRGKSSPLLTRILSIGVIRNVDRQIRSDRETYIPKMGGGGLATFAFTKAVDCLARRHGTPGTRQG